MEELALKEGDKVKDFYLDGISPEGEEGKFSLKDFLNKGKFVILYFYPKDNTPGCTLEAKDFRDGMEEIKDKAVIIGISPDSIESHKKFMKKHKLNFYLLSDPEKKILKEFGAYGEKKMYGKVRMGVKRSTFIISSKGEIVKAWINVRAKGHVEKVINEIKKLGG